jgi:hypothetical protein
VAGCCPDSLAVRAAARRRRLRLDGHKRAKAKGVQFGRPLNWARANNRIMTACKKTCSPCAEEAGPLGSLGEMHNSDPPGFRTCSAIWPSKSKHGKNSHSWGHSVFPQHQSPLKSFSVLGDTEKRIA